MRRSGAARSPATLPAPAARPSCGESATRPARQRRPAQSTGRKSREMRRRPSRLAKSRRARGTRGRASGGGAGAAATTPTAEEATRAMALRTAARGEAVAAPSSGAADLPQGRRSVLSTGPCTGPTPTARSSPTSRQRCRSRRSLTADARSARRRRSWRRAPPSPPLALSLPAASRAASPRSPRRRRRSLRLRRGAGCAPTCATSRSWPTSTTVRRPSSTRCCSPRRPSPARSTRTTG
mmetsp:Transcript_26340/g.86423  ORF Transcript_26340/g.86423 Transcript_26340/m.86423 type:complete len:238 (+) Transcript_26340:431-1144(+)